MRISSSNSDYPPGMSEAAVFRWWRHVRGDLWWLHEMPVTSYALADILGKCRHNVKCMMSGRKPPMALPKQLARIIAPLEQRAILLLPAAYNAHRPRSGEASHSIPHFVQVELPINPPYIQKIAPLGCWTLHARCASCNHNQFLPVVIDKKSCVACYHCLPPSQYPTQGATLQKESLVHAELFRLFPQYVRTRLPRKNKNVTMQPCQPSTSTNA